MLQIGDVIAVPDGGIYTVLSNDPIAKEIKVSWHALGKNDLMVFSRMEKAVKIS